MITQSIRNVVKIVLFSLCFTVFLSSNSAHAQDEEFNALKELIESLDRQSGTIELNGDLARINLSEKYYFLDRTDSNKILIDLWGNMETAPNLLGMILPKKYSPIDEKSWGVTIYYEEEGHVKDDDAANIDYDELLKSMQESSKEQNKYRAQQGYPPVYLEGWASEPFYDSGEKKLHWAKELRFEGDESNTLNYNIRILGRHGFLEMNFIAGIGQLEEIKTEVSTILNMTNFNEGYRYEDFNPEIDKIAAYGIGGLIAGKVLAKAGILAKFLLVFKKAGIFIIAGIGFLISKLRGKKSST